MGKHDRIVWQQVIKNLAHITSLQIILQVSESNVSLTSSETASERVHCEALVLSS